jgi:hypothetical protein
MAHYDGFVEAELRQQLATVQAERDEYRSCNEHHKAQFLATNLELSRMRAERDALKSELAQAGPTMKPEQCLTDQILKTMVDELGIEVPAYQAGYRAAMEAVKDWLDDQLNGAPRKY